MNPIKIIFLLLISHSIYCQIELWGVTSSGGQFNSGTIFKYLPETNTHAVVHSFNNCEGQPRVNHLIRTSTSRYIGTSDFGGSFGIGTISEYNELNNTFTILYNFDYATGNEPIGKLIEAPNGLIYGVTKMGGNNDSGVLFSFNLSTNSFSKLIDFDANNNGKFPTGPLVIDNNFIYGTTSYGGLNSFGSFYKFDYSSNTIAKILDFDGQNNGKFPNNSLMKAANGNFYGDTKKGGAYDKGSIFEYNPSNNDFTKKIDLDGITIGDSLRGSMVQASNGLLYGITDFVAPNIYGGTYFQYDPIQNIVLKKANLHYPRIPFNNAGITLGTDSHLYSLGYYQVYRYNISNNTCLPINEFDPNNYFIIKDILIEKSPGIFLLSNDYTSENSLTEFNLSSTLFTHKYFFCKSTDGYSPLGSLLIGQDGIFYGVLSLGGNNGKGLIYKFNPQTQVFSKAIEFNKNLYLPQNSMIQTKNGKMFGTTSLGGSYDSGVIYQYNSNLNTFQILHSFGIPNEIWPFANYGKLLEASNGKLYGSIISYLNENGFIFELIPPNYFYNKKSNFSISTGYNSFGSLIQLNDGKIFGLTFAGTPSNNGSIFEYKINSNQIELKIPFLNNQNYGRETFGDLYEAKNGLLYGLASKGGDNDLGVLFEYNTNTNAYSKKFDFNNVSSGNSPQGSLIQALDNNLYGYGYRGGINNRGTIFKYNINTNFFIKLFDFNGLNGTNPNSSLTQHIATITTTKSGNWNDPTVWENGVVPSNTSYITINTNHIIDIDGVPVAVKYVDLKGTINFINGGSLNLIE